MMATTVPFPSAQRLSKTPSLRPNDGPPILKLAEYKPRPTVIRRAWYTGPPDPLQLHFAGDVR